MEIVSFKGTNLGSLKRVLTGCKFSSTNYHNWLDLCYEFGLEENFGLKFALISILQIHCDFFLYAKNHDTNSQACEKSLQYRPTPHLCEIA